MPTFRTESTIPTAFGAFLLPIPSVTWFADSVLQALAEMTDPTNWFGDDEAQRQAAVQYASEMLAKYKLTAFNPFPVGIIMPFGGAVQPDGYLLCDGSSYLTTDYPELFAQVGYYWGGSGDNFNVPNLIDRVPVGAGGDFSVGASGGEQNVTLDTSQMPSHSHSDLGHSHTYQPPGGTILAVVPGEAPVALPNFIPSFTGSASANLTSTGGDGSHNNMQPYLATVYIIYAGR